MKTITKVYLILKDGAPVAKEYITVPYNADAVNNAFRELLKKYPNEEGYWTVCKRNYVCGEETA